MFWELSLMIYLTDEYTLIKGFAAKVPAKIMDEIRTLGADHNVLIEQDQVRISVYTWHPYRTNR